MDPMSEPKTPVQSKSSSMPDAPKHPTTQTIVAKDMPVNPSAAEPIMEVLKKHKKECILTPTDEEAALTFAKTFVDSLEGKSGIYMISGDDYSKSPNVLMKIGKAKDLKHRLRQYFFCYPGGFYIYGVILTLQYVPVPGELPRCGPVSGSRRVSI